MISSLIRTNELSEYIIFIREQEIKTLKK